MDYKLNLLHWPIDKQSRNFRVYVVQPARYESDFHAEILDACLKSLSGAGDYNLQAEPFDLITFPEAFITADVLCSALEQAAQQGLRGCVHIGLAANYEIGKHLFKISEAARLVKNIRNISSLAQTDLDGFENWLIKQPARDHINLACLFTSDSAGNLRVCLHPKLLRSKFELSTFRDHNMAEADLHSLVTLLPENKNFLPITIHPLICSDGLRQQNDRKEPRPLEVLTTHANSFKERLPDHIDVVSLCTCTPQQTKGVEGITARTEWHQDFRNSFVLAASDDMCARHQYATFIMSNFAHIPNSPAPKIGGLSGIFCPVPLGESSFPTYIQTSSYEAPGDGFDIAWDPAKTSGRPRKKAYIAAIRPSEIGIGEKAVVLGFTISRMLRDVPRWHSNPGLTSFEIYSVQRDLESGNLTLKVKE